MRITVDKVRPYVKNDVMTNTATMSDSDSTEASPSTNSQAHRCAIGRAPLKRRARIAGLWYLLMALGTAFGMGYVDPLLRAPSDGAATAHAIQSSEALFLAGCASTSLGLVAMLFLANALFELFVDVDRSWARLLVIFVVVGVTIALLNMANLLVGFRLAHGDGLPLAFDHAQRTGLMMTFLRAHRYGAAVATFFWGLWLFPFGLLILRSGFAPRVLGILMAAGCFPYLAHSAALLFFPDLAVSTARGLLLPTVGEVGTIAWLLVKGVSQHHGSLRDTA
jgi:hypothetical protein